MQVLIFGLHFEEGHTSYLTELLDALMLEGIRTFIYEDYLQLVKHLLPSEFQFTPISNNSELTECQIDFVITLGGDGTLLQAVTLVRDSGIPILGINLGRMGFLASIEKKYVSTIIRLLKERKYNLEERSMLRLDSNYSIFGNTNFALNDFTISKMETSSMIVIHVSVNGELLNSYWADGLIVCTPTGSTGYSLSCGGPILFPDSKNFVLTAVAPHNLNVRPIVLADTSEISLQVEGRTDHFLCTLDSRIESVGTNHKLFIRKCEFSLNLVQLKDRTFPRTLREKLKWGIDTRKTT